MQNTNNKRFTIVGITTVDEVLGKTVSSCTIADTTRPAHNQIVFNFPTPKWGNVICQLLNDEITSEELRVTAEQDPGLQAAIDEYDRLTKERDTQPL